LIDWQLYNK